MSLRCRLGWHSWMVRWRAQTTPLWASSYLLALTAMEGITIFCARCARVGHPATEG